MYRSPAELHSSMDGPPEWPKSDGLIAGGAASGGAPRQDIRYLVGVVVQIQDLRLATRAVEKLGLPVTHLPGMGAFLGRRNVTLLIGLPEGMQDALYDAIQKTCHQRIEYVSTPLEGAPMPIPLSTPVTVGGATMFTLDIDRYEEF